jgi:hypothetical protein
MRRTGLSIVYCAAQPTPSTALTIPVAADRAEDVKAYRDPAPPMMVASLRGEPRTLARIGSTTLAVVDSPGELPNGGWVLVLEAAPGTDHASCDLHRVPKGGKVEGIGRALVFASDTHAPDPIPPSWAAVPEAPFAPFEDAPPGALPIAIDQMTIEASTPKTVRVAIAEAAAEIPRYWLARMMFRIGLHGLRLGYVETYGRFFVDDRDDVQIGIAGGPAEGGPTAGVAIECASIRIPRAEALAVIERIYRAVAPEGYVERLT